MTVVPRPPAHAARIQVRTATDADLPVLVQLCDELRAAGGRPARDVLAIPADEVSQRLQLAINDETGRVIVATYGGDILGMAVLAPSHYGPLSGFSAVQLNHVVVAGRHRRHGVGRALVAAAAAFADEIGAEHVAVSVAPGLREPNRFYARLGFSPLVVRRVAPVSVLRRRLSTGEHPVAALEELTRKRLITRTRLRTVRRRTSV